MKGMAQALFFEKTKKNLIKASPAKSHKEWPLLDLLLQQGILSYVDYALAEKLLQKSVKQTQEAAAFVCFLSRASRDGHLCVKISEKEIVPNPVEIWLEDVSEGVEKIRKELEPMALMIRKGASSLETGLLSDCSLSSVALPFTPICRWHDYYYLQRYWVHESLFLSHWKRFEEMKPNIQMPFENVENQLQHLVKGGKLLFEQSQVILQALQNSLTIITGGPGTGKTYTAGQLIKIYWENLTNQQREHCEIAIAAPTGKAASNLQQSLKKAMGSDVALKLPEAKTLHSLLGVRSGIRRFNDDDDFVLSADLIIVDESSMIDVNMMSKLFSAIKTGARLVLLGDRYQLPPVEAGGLFSDLVVMKQKKNSLGELKKCLRAELKGIVEFAEEINQGNATKALDILNTQDLFSGVRKVYLGSFQENIKKSQQQLLKYVEPCFMVDVELLQQPKKLLEAFNKFRILTPLRQGPFGVEDLNDLFFNNMMKKAPKSGVLMVPIMIARNDYRLGLLNGEVGVLVCQAQKSEHKELQFQEGDYALFAEKDGEDDGVRKIPVFLLPKYEYAYCLSVHKSQGSEFERVLLLNPPGSESFGREILYTGATRAKKLLEVWSEDAILRSTIARQSKRLSGVVARF